MGTGYSAIGMRDGLVGMLLESIRLMGHLERHLWSMLALRIIHTFCI
jgi:hypothetical protein